MRAVQVINREPKSGQTRTAPAGSRRDRLAFVEALLNAPAPNRRLQQAMQRHAQVVRYK